MNKSNWIYIAVIIVCTVILGVTAFSSWGRTARDIGTPAQQGAAEAPVTAAATPEATPEPEPSPTSEPETGENESEVQPEQTTVAEEYAAEFGSTPVTLDTASYRNSQVYELTFAPKGKESEVYTLSIGAETDTSDCIKLDLRYDGASTYSPVIFKVITDRPESYISYPDAEKAAAINAAANAGKAQFICVGDTFDKLIPATPDAALWNEIMVADENRQGVTLSIQVIRTSANGQSLELICVAKSEIKYDADSGEYYIASLTNADSTVSGCVDYSDTTEMEKAVLSYIRTQNPPIDWGVSEEMWALYYADYQGQDYIEKVPFTYGARVYGVNRHEELTRGDLIRSGIELYAYHKNFPVFGYVTFYFKPAVYVNQDQTDSVDYGGDWELVAYERLMPYSEDSVLIYS